MQNGHRTVIPVESSAAEIQQSAWLNLVKAVAAVAEVDLKDTGKIKGKTCKIYNKESRSKHRNDVCPCGRLIRRHSNDGDCEKSDNSVATFKFVDGSKYSRQTPLNHYGTLMNGCKFIRCSNQTPAKVLYQLILRDCGGKKPPLIISVYGGAKYFVLTERLEKKFMRGIVDVATIADAWILTAGLNNGVSKLVGEGISQYRLLRRHPKDVVCVGLTMWGSVNEKTRINLKKSSQVGSSGKPCERQIPENVQEDRETLDPHHSHCVLFDSGSLSDYLSDYQRNGFVEAACADKDGHTCYAVTIVVEGGILTPQALQFDINNGRPVVVIHGSGRMADVLSNLIELTNNIDQNEQRFVAKKLLIL